MVAIENLGHSALLVIAAVLLALCACVGSTVAQQSGETAPPEDVAQRLAQLKTAGRDASLTVLPAGLIGRPVRQVGDVIALMLERAGMTRLEIDVPEFTPPEKADIAETARALGAYVKANPIHTDYALFADFLGSREKGFQEVRVVITNGQGEVVWQDRQTSGDPAFRRANPKEPMQCCLLVVERLRPVLGLDDPTRASAPEGKLAQRWAQQTGLPEKGEQDAMQQRQQAFKQAAGAAAVLVYPALAADDLSMESATHLAKLIEEAKLTKASAAEQGPQVKVRGSMNEQQVLWDMARGVRDFVKSHRPDADYVLFAHYLMGKDAAGNVKVGGVHFTICDRDGQWVIVDFQNSHHDDFNAIQPRSRDDCDRLVLRRLQTYCR